MGTHCLAWRSQRGARRVLRWCGLEKPLPNQRPCKLAGRPVVRRGLTGTIEVAPVATRKELAGRALRRFGPQGPRLSVSSGRGQVRAAGVHAQAPLGEVT